MALFRAEGVGEMCVCVFSTIIKKISQTECALQKPLPRQLESERLQELHIWWKNDTLSLRMK